MVEPWTSSAIAQTQQTDITKLLSFAYMPGNMHESSSSSSVVKRDQYEELGTRYIQPGSCRFAP
jgi:hypothetical protein